MPTKHFYSHNLGKCIIFKGPRQLGKSDAHREMPLKLSQPNPVGWVPKQDSVCRSCRSAQSQSAEQWRETQKVPFHSLTPGTPGLWWTLREEKTGRGTGMGEWPPPYNHTWYCRKVVPNATLIYSSLRCYSHFVIISSHSFIYRSTNMDCILLDHGGKSVVISLSGQIKY